MTKLVKDFEPYRNLWVTCSDWLRWYDMWMNDPMSSIDAENIEKNVSDAYKSMHKAIKQFADFESNSLVLVLVLWKIIKEINNKKNLRIKFYFIIIINIKKTKTK